MKCQWCGKEYKGQRGLTVHQRSCRPRVEANLQNAKPKFAAVAPAVGLERWYQGSKDADVAPYQVIGEVDPATGNIICTVWSTHSETVWHTRLEHRIGRSTLGETAASYGHIVYATSTKLDTPRVVGEVTRAGGTPAPVRVYETDEDTHAGFDRYGDEIRTKVRKVRIE